VFGNYSWNPDVTTYHRHGQQRL